MKKYPCAVQFKRQKILKYKVNSLAPGAFDYSLNLVNVKLISTINILSTLCAIAIRRMPQHLNDH